MFDEEVSPRNLFFTMVYRTEAVLLARTLSVYNYLGHELGRHIKGCLPALLPCGCVKPGIIPPSKHTAARAFPSDALQGFFLVCLFVCFVCLFSADLSRVGYVARMRPDLS